MGEFLKGRHTYGDIKVLFKGSVTAGAFCSIAGNVLAIMEGHRHDWVTTYPFTSKHFKDIWGSVPDYPSVSKGNIHIGSDVWIGQNVVLLGGIIIGHGAVIGANAVVVKDVAPYEIVGGVPAQAIRKRFTDIQIDALLKIQWWRWDDDKIKGALQLLMQPDIDKFIRSYL